MLWKKSERHKSIISRSTIFRISKSPSKGGENEICIYDHFDILIQLSYFEQDVPFELCNQSQHRLRTIHKSSNGYGMDILLKKL